VVENSIRHSLTFGVYQENEQVGFARVISDYSTFGYLCDVFVLSAHQGKGLGKWLLTCIMAHPDLQGLRRFMLMTRDAHTLYKPFGFTEIKDPGKAMEKTRPSIYTNL
jgi:GNAT superfamily N-acetyltransferase